MARAFHAPFVDEVGVSTEMLILLREIGEVRVHRDLVTMVGGEEGWPMRS
jgi:hypothetical protein